ncbi:NACHT domain-containing protein [Paenibacillus tyrfis]|uniref:NACHT domain-containing protein n=1 Tax=Paenibacillus tyrfis TaxID=1501230 RepID=A0A081NUW9_9BACL|nr:NACHT domain-containing protein [Paenibacillus tyrfis]KEQ22242.1 hypothetical protein ET33_27085 [Paenibacillus tyrfis]
MNYLLENLGDERFQELCQALLIKEFPNVQCFPIGQPDGGRDAVVYFNSARNNKEFAVFQVKFVKNPQRINDPHKWLLEVLEGELPKIKELIPRGAKSYYLLTNVTGTGHLDSGSIDKVHSLLEENLDIPVLCWWRDDLCKRLDSSWDLKWLYPDLVTGTDLFRYIVDQGGLTDSSKRFDAITAFVRAQYEEDLEVRFKQVELQNNLLDLFVDVPIHFNDTKEDRHLQYLFRGVLREFGSQEDNNVIGAATLFSKSLFQENVPQLVLEGAPGQGKSTLAQFLCQIYRMKLLKLEQEFNTLPISVRPSNLRIPIKVDLRNLASWLSKDNPFSSDEDDEALYQWEKSLESFLIAQIKYYSGGFEFSVSDLHAVAKVSSLLIVLDGLDEVADIQMRKELVNEVVKGINRLRQTSASLQVIITSRPSVFENSPGFPIKKFPHFRLVSLTKNLIDNYTTQWLRAKKIYGSQASEVKKILKNKLEKPHLRDLARNPMQLAILLSLIHTKGSSLPDKRTALYDSYVDLFFDREAEKDNTVRENRELLIDIHRFLAWILHSESEQGKHEGRINTERLQSLLSEYLKSEGRDSSMTESLFTGVVERVVFLVSRIQGTFEFEVQPLREYFVARHLYETAPYSPPGNEKKGTKPDRFDAIAKNFYWLNVTRFFCGCFSKGELPSLVERLNVLLEDVQYKNISHPRALTAMLLSDWVFSQNQYSMREAVKLVLKGITLRHVLGSGKRNSDVLVLPSGCGREQLVDECFNILKEKPTIDYAWEIIDLIVANSPKEERKNHWYNYISGIEGEKEFSSWLTYGLYMGVLPDLTSEELNLLIIRHEFSINNLVTLLRAGHSKIIESDEKFSSIVIDHILNECIEIPLKRKETSILLNFIHGINPKSYGLAFDISKPGPLREIRSRYGYHFDILFDGGYDDSLTIQTQIAIPENQELKMCYEFLQYSSNETDKHATEWVNGLAPWETIVENLRVLWGDRWSIYSLAITSSNVKIPKDKEEIDLFDVSTPLCKRTFYARNASSIWWRKQIESASTEMDFMFLSLLFLTSANSNLLKNVLDYIQPVFDKISNDNWEKVTKQLEYTRRVGNRRDLALNMSKLPGELTARTVAAIGICVNDRDSIKLYEVHLHDYVGTDVSVLKFCQRVAFTLVEHDPSRWNQAISIISRIYSQGGTFDAYYHSIYRRRYMGYPVQIPVDVAKQIANQPENYPRFLVDLAERACRDEVASQIVPIGTLAKKERWFENANLLTV